MEENKKKIKFVIGNGFDLELKFKMSYYDFFNNNLFNKKDVISCVNSYNTFYPNCKSLKTPENIWNIFFYLCSIDLVYVRYTDSNDGHYVIKVGDLEVIKWCDIEESMSKSFNQKLDDDKIPSWINIYELLFGKRLRNNIKDDLISQMLSNIFKGKKFSKEAFCSFLLDELKVFEKIFGEYIKEETNNQNKIYDRINLLSVIYGEDLNGVIYSIDSFNYSSINNLDVFHINGDTDKPIFGIDSKGIAACEPRYIFTKTYRRLEYNTIKRKEEFKDFDNLYIYGHSLNEQDYNYFFPLLDYLKVNDINSNTKIIFAYTIYDINKKDEIISNLTKGIAGLFEAYEDYKHITNEHRLMDILTFRNRLIIKEIK
ncbi:MAG: AbiH family protein [Bacilli bacterium]